MAQKIIWNKSAREKLDAITTYLEEEFSELTAKKFIILLHERLNILSRYPEIGRPSKKKKHIRIYKIDKKRNLYYRVDGNLLFVVYIFDTRQSPNSNPY